MIAMKDNDIQVRLWRQGLAMGRRKSDSDSRDSNLRGTAPRARTLARFTRAAGLAGRHFLLFPTPRRPSDAEPKTLSGRALCKSGETVERQSDYTL
jgi:hypothetical protein